MSRIKVRMNYANMIEEKGLKVRAAFNYVLDHAMGHSKD